MNQQDNQQNNQVANNTQDPQIQPGSLNYIPAGPSGLGKSAESIPTIATTESTAKVETASQPEIQKPIEVEPTIEEQEAFVPLKDVIKKEPPKETTQPDVSAVKEVPNVVDKTKDIAPLHHINQSHDKLTSLADKEEEEFIKKVETVHEHK